MPRCEGRPDGPCPHKVNNSTVINCQDMTLCPDCEKCRFPNTAVKKRDAKRNAPATRSSANSDRSTKEETLVKPVNSSKRSAVIVLYVMKTLTKYISRVTFATTVTINTAQVCLPTCLTLCSLLSVRPDGSVLAVVHPVAVGLTH